MKNNYLPVCKCSNKKTIRIADESKVFDREAAQCMYNITNIIYVCMYYIFVCGCRAQY